MQESTFIGRYLPQQFSDRNGQCARNLICTQYPVGLNQNVRPLNNTFGFWVPWLQISGVGGETQAVFTVNGASVLVVNSYANFAGHGGLTVLPFNEAGWIDIGPGTDLQISVSGFPALVTIPWYNYLR